jgi:metal-responsive CopG/Arc/MetJ family transcriptional regulator
MATDWKRLQLLLTPEMVAQVDEWRRRQELLPDRNEAIRRLLGMALAAQSISEPSAAE